MGSFVRAFGVDPTGRCLIRAGDGGGAGVEGALLGSAEGGRGRVATAQRSGAQVEVRAASARGSRDGWDHTRGGRAEGVEDQSQGSSVRRLSADWAVVCFACWACVCMLDCL